MECWIAPRDVRAGRSYGDEIITGIENARSFVLVLSRASNDSAFVAREVERAVSKKKPIFAIRVANVEPSPSLELFISGTQWIDAFSGRLGPHIDRLANLLAEEEGAGPGKPATDKGDAKPEKTPRARQQPFFLPLARGWFSGLPTTGHRSALTARIPSL